MSKAYEFSSNFMYLRLDFDLKITKKKSIPIIDEEEIKFPFGRSSEVLFIKKTALCILQCYTKSKLKLNKKQNQDNPNKSDRCIYHSCRKCT